MNDFYCDEVLSGKTKVDVVIETENVLAFYHTKPSYPSHIVVIPKRHVPSLLALKDEDDALLLELMAAVKQAAQLTIDKFGACRVITNLGEYQDSKHLHWHIVYGKKVDK
jgi:histidine triad (HIT) family protein